jgi:hypothetical protein
MRARGTGRPRYFDPPLDFWRVHALDRAGTLGNRLTAWMICYERRKEMPEREAKYIVEEEPYLIREIEKAGGSVTTKDSTSTFYVADGRIRQRLGS